MCLVAAEVEERGAVMIYQSVQFSCSVVSNSFRPHGLQHARPPCSSPTTGVYPNPCPLNWPLLTPSPPAISLSQHQGLFKWVSQSIGVSASTSVPPVNTKDWSPLGWTGWISLQSKGLSRNFSNTTVQKHQFFGAQLSLQSNSHVHTWLLGNTIALTRQTIVGKAMSLLFNMLFRLVITFLPRSKRLSISWLTSPSTLILEPPETKSANVSTVSHLFAMKWWNKMPWSSFSECWALRQLFHSPLSLSSRGFLAPLHFLP